MVKVRTAHGNQSSYNFCFSSDPGGGTYYAEVNGGTRFSLHTKDVDIAEEWKTKQLRKLRRKALGLPEEDEEDANKPREPLTLKNAWAQYIQLPNVITKSGKTVSNEKKCFDAFVTWCAEKNVTTVDAVTPEIITGYRRHILNRPKRYSKEENPGRTTANNYVRHLSAVWSHLTGEEKVYHGVNPFRSVTPLKVEEKEAKDRPWEEVKEIVAVAEEHGEDIHKFFVLTHMFGIRKLEALRVRDCHFNWSARTVTFHKTKPRKIIYTVPMPPEAIEELLRYRRGGDNYFIKPENAEWPKDVEYRWHPDSQWGTVFNIANKRRAKKELPPIVEFSPHQMRHTLITYLLANDWTLQQVADFLCQDEVSVTGKYGKRAPELRREALKINLKRKVG